LDDKLKNPDHLFQSALKSLPIPDQPSRLYQPVSYTLNLGGKRLRPRLVMLSCGLCGGQPEKAIPAALAVEMLHNFTLIHDDIMDNAETRRGQPTVHHKWDEATAILSGDVLFVMAMKQFTRYGKEFPEQHAMTTELTTCFLDAVQEVCDGQAMDMDFETRDDVVSGEYLQMIKAKTAALIRCSMQLGGLIAGAGKEAVEVCGEIGDHAGIAFQIQDDLLDAVGDASTFGKKVGGDIIEGKKTFLSILALERADDADRIILNQTLGDSKAGEDDILKVIRIYHDLGVIDEAAKTINHHYNNALEKLDEFEESEYQGEIKSLLDKLKDRDN